MTQKEEAAIRDICLRIEARYTGIVAGYRDFVSPALLPVDSDEPITVHAFCLTKIDYNEVYDYIQALVLNLACDQDIHLAFAIWNAEQARTCFEADVRILLALRGQPAERILAANEPIRWHTSPGRKGGAAYEGAYNYRRRAGEGLETRFAEAA